MVWGSLLSAIFSCVPLAQSYESFYSQHDDLLPAVDFELTWSLLIFSGVVYALGSLAFVRAFEEPPKQPLFYYFKHLQTDELLGGWLFLIGTIPSVPYSLIYMFIAPSATYFFALLASIFFVFATLLFVRACYPTGNTKVSSLLYMYTSYTHTRLNACVYIYA